METREFRASFSKTFRPFLLVSFAAAVFWGLTALSWDSVLASGALMVFAALLTFAAAILAYRLALRPVMLRVGPEGIFIKRLGVSLPWEAIGRIERLDWEQGDVLFELVETDAQHPVFDERSVLLGAALNQKIGLPPLAIQMDQYAGTAGDFEAAVRAAGGPDIVEGAPRAFKKPSF